MAKKQGLTGINYAMLLYYFSALAYVEDEGGAVAMQVRIVATKVGRRRRVTKGKVTPKQGVNRVRLGLLQAVLTVVDSLLDPTKCHMSMLCASPMADEDCYFVKTEDVRQALAESDPATASWLKVAADPNRFPYLAVPRADCEVLT